MCSTIHRVDIMVMTALLHGACVCIFVCVYKVVRYTCLSHIFCFAGKILNALILVFLKVFSKR